MSFLNDLIDSDEDLRSATASNDATLAKMIEAAGESGSAAVLLLALERGQIDASVSDAVMNAGVKLLGNDFEAARLGKTERKERLARLEAWVGACSGGDKHRMDVMLASSLGLFPARHDLVACELVRLGASGYKQYGNGATELSGARLGIRQEQANVLARAIDVQSAAVPALMKNAVASLNDGSIPYVARLILGDRQVPVNAVAYAIATGGTKAFELVFAALPGSITAVSLGESVDQVKALGLLAHGVDEVLACVTRLIAAGAKLKTPSAFMAGRMEIVPDPAFGAEHSKSDDAAPAPQLSYAAAMLASAPPSQVATAWSHLVSQGMEINAPVMDNELDRAKALDASLVDDASRSITLAHYAALTGDKGLLIRLKELGADFSRLTVRGASVSDYAQASGSDAYAVIDPAFKLNAAQNMPQADPRIERALSMSLGGGNASVQSPFADEDDAYFMAQASDPSIGSTAIGVGGVEEEVIDVGIDLSPARPAPAKVAAAPSAPVAPAAPALDPNSMAGRLEAMKRAQAGRLAKAAAAPAVSRPVPVHEVLAAARLAAEATGARAAEAVESEAAVPAGPKGIFRRQRV